MSSFYFKAVAADGKLRTGNLSGESDKAVARELRKQGLNPVYVGIEQKKSFEVKLPDFYRGRHRDILFFTQEISTLLNAGVPLDRALSITSELTEGPNFRTIVLDVLRVLKGVSRWPIVWPRTRSTSAICTSTWCAPERLAGRWRRCSTGWPSSSDRGMNCAGISFHR